MVKLQTWSSLNRLWQNLGCWVFIKNLDPVALTATMHMLLFSVDLVEDQERLVYYSIDCARYLKLGGDREGLFYTSESEVIKIG